MGPSDGELHRNRRRRHGRIRRRPRTGVAPDTSSAATAARSATRRLMGVSFDGTTSSTRWLVVDCANDPLGHPNSEVGADPARPYVSISIAHGIRRFEFMIHADESDDQADSPEFVKRMLAQMVPDPERVDIIRHRVYTHHSRIASAFRQGPVDARGRRRAPDAGVAGPGLQQRYPRRRQPRLEAGRGGQRSGRATHCSTPTTSSGASTRGR